MENQEPKVTGGALQRLDGTWKMHLPKRKTITAANLMESIKQGLVPPCPRCGYCGFIEDASMNLAGVCPECNGKGRKLHEIAGGSWEDQCMAARQLNDIFKAESEILRREKDELISIAQTINEYASGWKPWGGCRCDYGEDGLMPLRGDKCGRCKALERLKEITQQNETMH